MLLAIDIGNTTTVLGGFDGQNLRRHWRISTSAARTADENHVLLAALLGSEAMTTVDAAIIASVVPGTSGAFCSAIEQLYGVTPLLVTSSLPTGMPVLYENPAEVGADRIVNAVAAYDRWARGLIVVDFGTATTFDCISPAGEYLGGVITPGIRISADALYRHAARLPRVEIRRPEQVVGRNTETSMQAGLYFGYAGLVDGIVERIRAELEFEAHVVATGGLSGLIASASHTIAETDELLTLHGLRIIHSRNC